MTDDKTDGHDEPPDSMEAVLAEALAEEDSDDGERLSSEGVPSIDEVDIRDALREALRAPVEPVSLTADVQKKLREDPELEGRYFADGWSTASSPKETYLITSVVMLAVVVIVYLLLSPYGL